MATAPEDVTDQLSRLTVSESNIEFLRDEDLGRGAYGRVFKARYRGSLCAAKEIHSILIEAAYTPAERRRLQDNFIHECSHCSNLNHPNIVHFIGIYHPPQQLFPVMIMELMDESLTAYAEKPNISFKRRVSILYDVAEGLSYLHSRNPPVIHRDLSPNNVLLKHLPLLPVAKIADLGVAKIVNVDDKSSKSYQTKVPGTVDFMPLEAFGDKPKYGTPLDVFSYGGIMLYTVNGKWPGPTALADFDPVTRQVRGFSEVERRQEHLDKMRGEAEVLRPLIEACLDNDPVKRPSILELSAKIKPLKVCLCHSYCVSIPKIPEVGHNHKRRLKFFISHAFFTVLNLELLGGEITPKFHIPPKILRHVISNSTNAYISPFTDNTSFQCCCPSINT